MNKQEQTRACPNCGGAEYSMEGGPCPACKGTGKVPAPRPPEQARKLRLLRQQMARRKANLLDPNWGDAERFKRFPSFTVDMTTAQYIAIFQMANPSKLTFTHAARVPPVPQPEEN